MGWSVRTAVMCARAAASRWRNEASEVSRKEGKGIGSKLLCLRIWLGDMELLDCRLQARPSALRTEQARDTATPRCPF